MHRLSMGKIIVLTLALLTIIHSDSTKLVQPTIFLVNKPQILKPTPTPIQTQTPVSLSSQVSQKAISPAFYNQQGSSTTSQQISSFKSFIDLSAAFYRYNVEARLNFISNKMNQTYGTSGTGFSVIMLNTTYSWANTFYSYNSNWAAIQIGSDPVFPLASYMFIKSPINDGRTYFHEKGTIGSGIDSDFQGIINNIILLSQTSQNGCWCSGQTTSSINSYLRSFDGSTWTVHCSSEDSLFLSVYTYTNKYIVTKPRYCYYALYAFKF